MTFLRQLSSSAYIEINNIKYVGDWQTFSHEIEDNRKKSKSGTKNTTTVLDNDTKNGSKF